MNTKLMMIGALAVACAGRELAAMPTKVETLRSEPTVQKLMASDLAAIKSGAKTRAEVASVAIKLAEETDSEAEKLLLMKGAFSLYVRSGEFDRAVETIEALQTAIPDIPDENVVSIITTSLRNISRSEGKLLYAFLDDIKASPLPVFALAATPLGPYREGPGELNVPVVCGGQVVLPGDLLVGDSDGLVVIPRRDAPALLEAVRQNLAMEQEEIRHMRDGSFGEAQHKEIFTGAFLKRGGSFD